VVWVGTLTLGFRVGVGVGFGVMREVVSNSQCRKQCEFERNFLWHLMQ
jgi:hypothetical protein